MAVSVGAATGAKKIYTYDKDTGGFTLMSFGEELLSGTDYAYKDGVLSIKSGKAVTIRNKNAASATTDSIFVDGSAGEMHITLSGVNIDASKKGRAALSIKEQCENTVNLTLAAGTSNILMGGAGHAGLEKSGYSRTYFVPGEGLDIFEHEMQIASPLMIDGKGSLTAKGGRGAPAIGGAAESQIKLVMGTDASVKATPGSGCKAAAIGDTEYYQLRIDNPEGKPLLLDGRALTVTHHSEEKAVYTLLTKETHTLQVGDAVQEIAFDEATQSFVAYATGDFKVTGNVSYGDVSYEDGVLTVKTVKPLTIANRDPAVPTEDRIAVSGGVRADITLAGVNIESSRWAFSAAENRESVALHLAAGTKNTLHAGFGYQALASNGAMLTVDGDGALSAIGGLYGAKDFDERLIPLCAAIDGGKGEPHITINGGTITAIGGPARDGSGHIAVNGGSLKMLNSDAVVTNSEGERLYPLALANPKGERVLVNGESYATRSHALLDDTNLYLWLPAAESCSVIVGQTPMSYTFDMEAESWQATETVLAEDSFAACITPVKAPENYPDGILMEGKLYYPTLAEALADAESGSFSADDVIELRAETTKLKNVAADRLTLLQDVPGKLAVGKSLLLDMNGKTVGELSLEGGTVIVQDSTRSGRVGDVMVLSGTGILDGVNCAGRLFAHGNTLHLLSGSYDLTKAQNWGRVYAYGGSLSFAEPVSKVYDGTTESDVLVTWNGEVLAGTAKYDSADALTATKLSFTTGGGVFPEAVTLLHGAEITPVQLPAPTVSISGKYKYTGSPITPNYSVTMAAGYESVPYRVSITDNVRPGTGRLTVQPDAGGNYAFETVTVSFTINKVLIEPAVTVLGSYRYTGEPIIPAFTVEDDYEDVTESDYTFTVEGNIDAGMATLTVSPAPDGNYRFSPVTVQFEIEPAAEEQDASESEASGETQEGSLGTSPEEQNVMTASAFAENGSLLIIGAGTAVLALLAWLFFKRKKNRE